MFLHPNTEVVVFKICPVPNGESFYWRFKNNKTFEDLKNDLDKKQKMKKENHYFEKDGVVINDNETLIKEGIRYNSCINAVSDDCLKVLF